MSDAAILDDALDLLGDRAPEYGGGLSNHGPMAAEALVHLGRAELVPAWAEAYVGRLDPFVASDDERPPALGDLSSYAAWLVRARAELAASAPWRPVVTTWCGLLVDGAVAAAGHGLLRTAHAVRALTMADTAPRRAELARGLAYWAATYQRLPGVPRPTGHRRAAAALAALPAPAGGGAFFISDAVRALDDVPGFPAAVDALDPSELVLTRLVDAIVPRALAGAERHAIVYVHTLTVPAAVRTLASVLPPGAAATALAYTWQAMAALAAAFPVDVVSGPAAGTRRGTSADELLDAAVANGDEHAIKVTAAALDEVAAGADPAILSAALALVRRM